MVTRYYIAFWCSIIMASIVTNFAMPTILVFWFESFKYAMLVWFAPKVFLLQELAKLVK